jgi:beta-ureidopropionase / N-carbamoyl-L-amino-acid hydrolase
MQRRKFIKQSSLTTIGIGVFGSLLANHQNAGAVFHVNEQRIESRIFELAKFGVDEKGRGYRIAFSKGDIEGRAWFMDLMKKAGLNPTIDAAGNIIGKRKGKNASLKTIAFGSHIDMVPDGGNYDGTLGSISALEVIEILNENNVVTEHPLEVIIFANEEGGTIGSMAMAVGLTEEGLQQKSQMGLTMAEGIRAIGGNPGSIKEMQRKKGDLKAFLELHIEQGGILEQKGLQIGVVEGIVGIVHWEVTVEGFANHAGTTPMNMRKDALLAASELVIAVNEEINKVEGRQVGTIGKIAIQPGAYNVIPGKVTMGLEIRDLDNEKINRLFVAIEKRASAIASTSGTSISFVRQANESKAALTDPSLQQQIIASCKELGFTWQRMQSGAGHDAQEMAHIAPVAMIFIPSKGGISHSPKEFSTATDMANGANVLLTTILKLDKG